MFSRARDALGRRFTNLSLRVRCWNLPPVATHLACFLLGTLLFEPDSSGRVPPGILVPWTTAKVEGGIQATAEYALISGAKHCLLLTETVKLWRAEEKKLFVLVGKSRLTRETLEILQKSDTRLARRRSDAASKSQSQSQSQSQSSNVTAPPQFPHCEKTHVIIYP